MLRVATSRLIPAMSGCLTLMALLSAGFFAHADTIVVDKVGTLSNGYLKQVTKDRVIFQQVGKKQPLIYHRNQVRKIVYEPLPSELRQNRTQDSFHTGTQQVQQPTMRLAKHSTPPAIRNSKADTVTVRTQKATAQVTNTTTKTKNPFSLGDLMKGHGESRFEFPQRNQQFDPSIYKTSSLYKGNTSKALYGGLFNYAGRDTFRMDLPAQQTQVGHLRFNLYGVYQTDQYPEQYISRAVFLNPYGQIIGTSPVLAYGDQSTKPFFEWIEYQEAKTGLSPAKKIDLIVPKDTKTIAFQAQTTQPSSVHLVGFISNVSFEPNYNGSDEHLLLFEPLQIAGR